MSTVRKATQSDRQDVWRLLLQSHSENGLFSLSPRKVDYLLDRVLNPELIHPEDQGPRGVIGVIGDAGSLEALCFVILGSFWYSEEYHLEELMVFVDPEFRHSEHAKSLIEWMKHTSDTLGIKLVTGIMSNHRTEAKVRMYQRHLPKVGAFFMYPNSTKTLQ